jgi:hypothetical protein
MMRARACMIAGLAAIGAITCANAAAQDCPDWLRWACSSSGSSNPVREAPRERQRPRTPAASSSQIDPLTKHARAVLDGATPQQTKRPEALHPVKVTRNTRSSDLSGDQRPVAMNGQEREALFQKFSAWQKARRLDADANSDPSGHQHPVAINDQEKEALFQKFSAWQKAHRLNADADR